MQKSAALTEGLQKKRKRCELKDALHLVYKFVYQSFHSRRVFKPKPKICF